MQPVANVGMEITIVKTSTNASGLDNFRIYLDNMASINGQAIGVHLDVSSTTKVVTCIAFDMSSWICTKQHANGGGSEGGKLESTTIGIESPASSRFSTATVEGELLVRNKASFVFNRNERNALHTDIVGQYKIASIVEKENGASANMYSVTSVMHGLVVGDSICSLAYTRKLFFNENVFFVKTIIDSNTFDIVAGQDSSKYTYSQGGAFIRLDDATS